MNTKFVVITPVYNAEDYIGPCLNSTLSQNYDNFKIVVIDDCSTDSTWAKINEMEDPRLIRISNIQRKGALHNIYDAIRDFADEDAVIITVDGDDRLAHENVFLKLDQIYSNTDTLITYGSYLPDSGSYAKFGEKISDVRTYRKSGLWQATHLRTFKKKLWDKINPDDFKDQAGNFYQVSWDNCFLFSLLEMAGNQRTTFIEEALYLYNDLNSLNDMKLYKDLQIKTSTYLRSKPAYDEIIGDI